MTRQDNYAAVFRGLKGCLCVYKEWTFICLVRVAKVAFDDWGVRFRFQVVPSPGFDHDGHDYFSAAVSWLAISYSDGWIPDFYIGWTLIAQTEMIERITAAAANGMSDIALMNYINELSSIALKRKAARNLATHPASFLLYGSTGFVGREMARLAEERGLPLVIAGRSAEKVAAQAVQLGVEGRAFSLDDPAAIDRALAGVAVVLHCAGPYIHTWKPMVEACLRTGTHYLDITGELPVLEGIAARDAEARQKGVMLLPAVGFDVLPSDCLALHLKQRLPSATELVLAFHSRGPGGSPPGSINTLLETIIPAGFVLRQDGRLAPFPRQLKTRRIDFGSGPVEATLFPWADAFTAYTSTGIPNIENYVVINAQVRQLLAIGLRLKPLFRLKFVRRFMKGMIKAGSTAESRSRTHMSMWGEAADDEGRTAVARLHGPEGSVVWTSLAALAVVEQVLQGNFLPGYQTPALAYGADFVLGIEGVRREDLG